jgi:pilus assembly protein CpaC
MPAGKPEPAAPAPELPAPRTVSPFGPGQVRLPRLANEPAEIVGAEPRPTQKTIDKYKSFIKGFVEPEVTLDLVVGRTRLMVLKETPKRIQIADEGIAGYTLITPKEISLQGRSVGVTNLNLWFVDAKDPNKETVLSYYVRVGPDPELKRRLEQIYKALGDEINCAFPDSTVCLQLVGDKVVLSGYVRDVSEATHILRIVRANTPNQFGGATGRALARVPFSAAPTSLDPAVLGPTAAGLEAYEAAGAPFVINLLHINGEQQVMLRVTVAEVNRAAARSIGLDFSIMNKAGVTVFASNTGSITTGGITGANGLSGLGAFNAASTTTGVAGVATGIGGFNNLPVALDNGQIRLAISALRTLNYARSLAEPNLVTLNGQTANFQAGGQFPVPVLASANTTQGVLQGVQFVPYGVQLSFTPYITDRDRIRLQVAAEVSGLDIAAGTTNVNGTNIPNINTRNFATTVELREGQTLAVAGLVQKSIRGDATRVPLFGDIPVLGRLWSFDRVTAGEQELVVLITPELVHPMDHKEVPPLPGSDFFEPNDVEFYLLGRIESHHPWDHRSTIRTDWDRQHEFRQFEQMYISGPHGDGAGPP